MAIAFALVLLVLSSAAIHWSIPQYRKERAEGPVVFMGPRGQLFLLLVSVPPLVVFIVSAIFLLFTKWIVCLVAVPIAMWVLGPVLAPAMVLLWVRPMYSIFRLFSE